MKIVTAVCKEDRNITKNTKENWRFPFYLSFQKPLSPMSPQQTHNLQLKCWSSMLFGTNYRCLCNIVSCFSPRTWLKLCHITVLTTYWSSKKHMRTSLIQGKQIRSEHFRDENARFARALQLLVFQRWSKLHAKSRKKNMLLMIKW